MNPALNESGFSESLAKIAANHFFLWDIYYMYYSTIEAVYENMLQSNDCI